MRHCYTASIVSPSMRWVSWIIVAKLTMAGRILRERKGVNCKKLEGGKPGTILCEPPNNGKTLTLDSTGDGIVGNCGKLVTVATVVS